MMKTFFTFLISAAVMALFIWYIRTHGHNGNTQIQPLTNAQAASQAAALAGQVAAANGNTAIYTPLLYAAAANLAAANTPTNSPN